MYSCIHLYYGLICYINALLSFTLSLGHTSCVSSVVISSDNQYIVSGSLDQTIKLWDLKTGTEIKTLGNTSIFAMISHLTILIRSHRFSTYRSKVLVLFVFCFLAGSNLGRLAFTICLFVKLCTSLCLSFFF